MTLFTKKRFLCVLTIFCALSLSAKDKKSPKEPKPPKVKTKPKIDKSQVFQAKTVDNIVGDVRITMLGKIGSFQYYICDSKKHQYPVLSNFDEYTSSFYSLKVGMREYKLCDNASVTIGSRKNETGSQIVYAIPGKARLLVKCDCLSLDLKNKETVIKVSMVITNKGKKTETFALKNVLDTYLGEQKNKHFSSASRTLINKEEQFRDMRELKYLISENDRAGMQILLCGADVTPPEEVSVGNKDIMALSSWIPLVKTGRSFDSVLSYNNSAVAINWAPVKLASGDETTIVYYIVLSCNGDPLCGEDFINRLGGYGEEEIKNEPIKEFTPIQEFTPMEEFTPEEPVLQVQPVKEVKPVIPKEKLNYEYIQKLLDRINMLESSNTDIGREEILQLSSELDAILEALGQ